MIHTETFVLGPIENNTYLITSDLSKEALIIDPSIPSREILESMRKNDLNLSAILITHAHFDHIGGAKWFKNQFFGKPKIFLHKDDLDLWLGGGGAGDFGFNFDAGDQPETLVEKDQIMQIDEFKMEILHTPGHTPGHITFYFPEGNAAFCGDLIFFQGVGRTDLRYSDEKDLYSSIRQKIFTLPDQTILYPGHGPNTTVGEEKQNNPYLN